MKLHRIAAIIWRHIYLYQRSLPRWLEIFYWPLLDLLLWGFISLYLSRFSGSVPKFVGFFLGALIFWDILYRANQGVSISFLEDVWSRNLLNLFASPLTAGEFLAALMTMGIIKMLTGTIAAVIMARILYSFNIFTLGLAFIPFVLNLLLMGWAIGIVTTAVILRFGMGAEVLAWGLALIFQPISAVFYPVSTLPPSLQTLAFFTPSAHVFEGMRQVLSAGAFPWHDLIWAFGLNAVYLSIAVLFFFQILRQVRRLGLLMRVEQ